MELPHFVTGPVQRGTLKLQLIIKGMERCVQRATRLSAAQMGHRWGHAASGMGTPHFVRGTAALFPSSHWRIVLGVETGDAVLKGITKSAAACKLSDNRRRKFQYVTYVL